MVELVFWDEIRWQTSAYAVIRALSLDFIFVGDSGVKTITKTCTYHLYMCIYTHD